MRTNCHWLDPGQCFADLLHVIREFERNRSGERQHGHALLRRYSALQELHRRHTDVPDLIDGEMNVVDDEGDEASRRRSATVRRIVWSFTWRLLFGQFGGGTAFERELRNLLKLAAIRESKIFLMQAADGVSGFVADDHGNPHHVDGGLERRRFIADGDFTRLGLRSSNRENQYETGPIAREAVHCGQL